MKTDARQMTAALERADICRAYRAKKKKFPKNFLMKARDGIRTRDPNLGKVVLHP